jgi:hypothetical protein
MKRSAMRDGKPDYASLHPGYMAAAAALFPAECPHNRLVRPPVFG